MYVCIYLRTHTNKLEVGLVNSNINFAIHIYMYSNERTENKVFLIGFVINVNIYTRIYLRTHTHT